MPIKALEDGSGSFEDIGNQVSLQQRIDVDQRHSNDLASVLAQDRGLRVLVDNVVVRVAGIALERDFAVEVITAILSFPIAKRLPQDRRNERAVNADVVAARATAFPFVREDEVVRTAGPFEQVRERLTEDALVQASGDPLLLSQDTAIGVDVLTAQSNLPRRSLPVNGTPFKRPDKGRGGIFLQPPACATLPPPIRGAARRSRKCPRPASLFRAATSTFPRGRGPQIAA